MNDAGPAGPVDAAEQRSVRRHRDQLVEEAVGLLSRAVDGRQPERGPRVAISDRIRDDDPLSLQLRASVRSARHERTVL